MTLTVALLGVQGYGRHHLPDLARLREQDAARLVAVADPQGAAGLELPSDVSVHADLADLLDHVSPDIVAIATPIHTHHPLAARALRAGAHVLLEKPPTASIEEFEDLLAISRATGRSVQVGFQSLGSRSLPRIEALLAEGVLGPDVQVGGLGTWQRSTGYYARSRWAGRRRLDGVPVVDGVVTNPLAHAIATALKIHGTTTSEDIASVEVELYRAHEIEADDTSSVRVRTRDGATLMFALTLCAAVNRLPEVLLTGDAGRARFAYTDDHLRVSEREVETLDVVDDRVSLMDDLVAHITEGTELLVPLESTGAFMRVVEAVRTAPEPSPVDPRHVTWHEAPDGRRPVIADVDSWCARVVAEQRHFSELGAPWTGR